MVQPIIPVYAKHGSGCTRELTYLIAKQATLAKLHAPMYTRAATVNMGQLRNKHQQSHPCMRGKDSTSYADACMAAFCS